MSDTLELPYVHDDASVPAPSSGPQRPSRRRRAGLVGAAALLFVSAGAVTWQVREHGGPQLSRVAAQGPGGPAGSATAPGALGAPPPITGNEPLGQPGQSTTAGTTTTAAKAAAAVDAGVVDITTVLGYSGAEAAGTGMVLTSSGEVVTNNHVDRGRDLDQRLRRRQRPHLLRNGGRIRPHSRRRRTVPRRSAPASPPSRRTVCREGRRDRGRCR